MINQKHDWLFGEVETDVFKSKIYVSYISLHNIPLVDMLDIVAGNTRNHQGTLISSCEDS